MAAKKLPDVTASTTQRLNVRVDAQAYRRLMVTCVMSKRSPGEVVAELIDAHLKRWAMPADLSARSKSTDRQELAAEERESAEPIAA